MGDTSGNTKRIAKNTLALYIRMLFLMFISFYTSRVVLRTLGEEDFGVYNIVGGVVVLFTFINGAMTTGTQRHLSYELGKGNGDISKIFSACLNIHLCLAGLIIILAETIGLWFLNTQMNFPDGRMPAVNWVYQLSILSCVFSVIRIPYNATIIAYEKMSFYAYVGIAEGLLKLAVAFLITISLIDKLIFYAILLTAVSAVVTMVYYFFCKLRFKEMSYRRVSDKALYGGLLSFSGWTIFGSVANIARNQGVGIIINIFYGVTINAAIGIANQVNSAIGQFVSGFQQAFNPQLTKSEAQGDRSYQFSLINKTAKFSYLIVLFFAVPVILNLDFLLSFWLGEYPTYTKEICFWIVIATLIDSISGPLWVTIFATGKIKSYQIVISLVLLLNLPLTYLCGKLGFHPQYSFAFLALLNLAAIIVRVIYLHRDICFSVTDFIKHTILPIALVTVLIIPIVIGVDFLCKANGTFPNFLIRFSTLLVSEIVLIIFLGLTKQERSRLSFLIRSKLKIS